MAQDTALLRYLLKGARRAPGSGSQRDLSFEFDGTNDYISSNATIGRTGYDMNVSGNVSTGSDGDGNYMSFTLSPVSLVVSTTAIPNVSLSLAHSIAIKIKTGSDVTTAQTVFNNIASASNRVGISIVSGALRAGIYNGTSYVGKKSFAVSANTTYIIHYTWDGSSVGKIYSASVESATVPAGDPSTSGTVGVSISRNGSGFGGFVYWCACWNKELSQAEVTADYALGNTTKNDPSIVAYYIPENLQYNTQYGLNPKALDQSNWIKTGATTVTADTTVAPDGTTTADTLAISGTASQGCTTVVTSISGGIIASKTFIVKAFVKVAAGTSSFRLECSHNGVATYNSSDQTATTTRQEFTFTKAFTSSTSGTGITYGIDNSSGATNPTLEVRNVRLFLVNETLRDESPNIGGFIGWKTPLVMSARVKPDINSADTPTKQCFFQLPWHYMQLRTSNNTIQFRSDTTIASRTAPTQNLGTGFRGKAHMLFVKYRDGTGRLYKAYVNGTLVSGSQTAYSNTIRPATTIYRTNASVGFYSTDYRDGNIRDIRAYTFTGSFTDADALAIYNGGEPTSSGITKYLHYKPPVGEVGTTTQDQSSNDRDGTLNGGVTRDYI